MPPNRLMCIAYHKKVSESGRSAAKKKNAYLPVIIPYFQNACAMPCHAIPCPALTVVILRAMLFLPTLLYLVLQDKQT